MLLQSTRARIIYCAKLKIFVSKSLHFVQYICSKIFVSGFSLAHLYQVLARDPCVSGSRRQDPVEQVVKIFAWETFGSTFVQNLCVRICVQNRFGAVVSGSGTFFLAKPPFQIFRITF